MFTRLMRGGSLKYKEQKEWDELLSDLRGDGNLSHERTSDEEKVIRDYLWSQGPWI